MRTCPNGWALGPISYNQVEGLSDLLDRGLFGSPPDPPAAVMDWRGRPTAAPFRPGKGYTYRQIRGIAKAILKKAPDDESHCTGIE